MDAARAMRTVGNVIFDFVFPRTSTATLLLHPVSISKQQDLPWAGRDYRDWLLEQLGSSVEAYESSGSIQDRKLRDKYVKALDDYDALMARSAAGKPRPDDVARADTSAGTSEGPLFGRRS